MRKYLLMAFATVSFVLAMGAGWAAPDLTPPASLDLTQFKEPEAVLWPGYFWLWNAPLDPDTLRAQLRDMAAHGARSVCMLPMPHGFRPDSTNNGLDPDYLTPEYFDRVRLAVDEAARLGMHWWLYDEGGWPSGQALGRVVEGHPELGVQRMVRERIETAESYEVPKDSFSLVTGGDTPHAFAPGETWMSSGESAWLYSVKQEGRPNLLNPDATKRFIDLTHEGYRRAIGGHFGKTVRFTFTDEPGVPNLDVPKSIPWTQQMDALYTRQFGGNIKTILPRLFEEPGPDAPEAVVRARIQFYDLWTGRFRDAYFGQLRDWCHGVGLGSGGHLNGEDETLNVVRHGFGQALRQLRAMDVPGVDVIWRQLFPGKPDPNHFPKYASSAAHQNGTRFAFTESFCVYGNGLTPAQMKWLIDYQFARGLNLFVGGCLPLSTRDHHMTGERPHFGPSNPLWDHLPGFHAYTARLGYLLSIGKPKITTALYYPARDMWACGLKATDAANTQDQLAAALLARQCDFDLVDDDLLSTAKLEEGAVAAGAMRYDTIVCGYVRWMQPESRDLLARFAQAGGKVLCLGSAPGTDGKSTADAAGMRVCDTADALVALVAPTLLIDPPAGTIRATARATEGGGAGGNGQLTIDNGQFGGSGEIAALFNEGGEAYTGTLVVEAPNAYLLDPQTGTVSRCAIQDKRLPLHLQPGESRVFFLTAQSLDASTTMEPVGEPIILDGQITATPRRHFIVGEHDFEIVTPVQESVPFEKATRWADWLGADYSGEVDYNVSFDLPEAWANAPLQLECGGIEYAATVLIDGKAVGQMLWPPWRITLPPTAAGKHEIIIRVANTLANELSSDRVTALWSEKKGPGWPSPYHERALVFERESRGGGMQGPVLLRRM
jgi:hypothetical protein